MYMAVELDEFEFCRVYFDDINSLSIWSGIPVTELRYYLRYNFIDFKKNVRYIKVIY